MWEKTKRWLGRRPRRDIIILASGQSNDPQDRPYNWNPEPNLTLWDFNGNTQPSTDVGTAFLPINPATVGMCTAAANKLAQRLPECNVRVINVYRGGKGLANWSDTPPEYNFREALIGNVTAALALLERSSIDYFIWAGCESDANNQNQELAVNMENWLFQWLYTQSWFDVYTPSYILGMSPWAASAPGNNDFLWRRYNGALRKVVAFNPSSRKYIDFDDFDISHYDTGSDIPYIHRTDEGYFRAGEKVGMVMLTGISEPIVRSRNSGGAYTPVFDPASFINCSAVVLSQAKYARRPGTNIVDVDGRVSVSVIAPNVDTSFWASVPVKVKEFPGMVNGRCTSSHRDAGLVLPVDYQQAVQVFFNARVAGAVTMMYEFSYMANDSDLLPNSPPGTT